jgi:hypothetical protein
MMSLVLVVSAALTAVGEARAQWGWGWRYPMGYGGYGWGGWGSTLQGSMARGLGVLSAGRGVYNQRTAQAAAIDVNTVLKWNRAVGAAYQAATVRYSSDLRRRRSDINKAQGEIHDRLRNHPEQLDITDGDALNTLLDVLLNPATADASLQAIKTPLRHDLIRDIPFEYASEGMTVCLDRMTADGQWPLALRPDEFRPEREAVRKAISAALEEDKAGNLEPETIQKVQTAIDELRSKFERVVPQSSSDYVDAQQTINALTGITKMLYSPKMEQIIGELEDYQGTTVGDLLAFMQSFNLRFGPANSYRQRQIYMKLYPLLAEQANGPLGSVTGEVAAVASDAVGGFEKAADELKSAAVGFFSKMKW